MYMFLSDRKRRKYLSLALPQNLSSKKLSFKDRGFFKKNIRNSLEPLSFPLVKQQKILYEKHILFPLKNNMYPFYKGGTHSGTHFFNKNNTDFFTQIYIGLWSSISPFKSTAYSEKKSSGYVCISPKNKGTPFFEKKIFQKTSCASVADNGANSPQKALYNNKKNVEIYREKAAPCYRSTAIPLQIYSKKSENMCTDFSRKYRKIFNFYPEGSFDKFLCVYVQTIKTKNIESAKGEKQKYNLEKISLTKNCLLNPSLSLYFCKKFVSPPLFANGRNKYLYCRFLFNKEHIKANINPQITKESHKKNKSFAKLLHERKKIMLFYGQIAKKDLRILCKKAKKLPGLFEESIHILLESRVDVLVHRAGFSKSIAMARQLIRQGIVYVNGKKLCSCKIGGKPGDIYTIGVQSSSYELLQRLYINTTTHLYNIYLSKGSKNFQVSKKKILYLSYNYRLNGQSHKTLHLGAAQKSEHYSNPKGFFGNLFPGLFLYKNLCKKKNATWPKGVAKASLFSKNKKNALYFSIKHFFNEIFPRSWCEATSTSQAPNLSFLRPFLYKDTNASRFLVYMHGIFLNVYIASLLKNKAPVRKMYKAMVKKECIFVPCTKNIQNANCALYWGQKPLHLEISHKTTSFIYLYKPQKLISPICMDFYAFKFFK